MECYFRIDSSQGVHLTELEKRGAGCNCCYQSFREPADGLTYMRLWVSVAIAFLLTLFGGGPAWAQQSISQQTCSRDQTATVQPGAAAWLGGIIALNAPGTGGYGCGKPDGSMQSYEAIRWVLDLLNKKGEKIWTEFLDDYYVPGIPLGVKMRNYCLNDMSALAAAADIFPETGWGDITCSSLPNNFTLGILGASTSGSSMLVSDAGQPYNIPLVSYEATAKQLTAPGMYTNFMRTISPDGPLIQVIVSILERLNWDRIIIVYDSGTYGSSAYTKLHAQLITKDICLTTGIMIEDKDLSTANAVLQRVLRYINSDSNSFAGVIFFGSPSYAQELLKHGNNNLPDAGRLQWLFVDFPLHAQFEAASIYQRGIISISAGSRFIVEFEDHWVRIDENNPSPENPWFQDWFASTYNCQFGASVGQRDCSTVFSGKDEYEREASRRAQYQQDQYVEAAVMAVFAYARALRTAQMTKCGVVSGMCQALRDMTRKEFYEDFLKMVDFTFSTTERVPSLASSNVEPYKEAKRLSFTAEGDIEDPSYFIWNYKNALTGGVFAFRRIGSYISNQLNLDLSALAMYDQYRNVRLDPVPPSSCPANGCTVCLGVPADMNYYYQPGDIVINGIFSLHEPGASRLSCGKALSPNQYQYLQAMIYAVEQVNSNNNILHNIRLGGLGIDDCSSSILGQAFLAQLHRGDLMIKDMAGNTLDPLTIEAYTAAYTSPVTTPLADAMNHLNRPMVGYRAGGSELDNSMMYPYYVSALPSLQEEIKAIILMLKKFNWMHVQVLVSPVSYSHDAEMIFRDLAAREGICIVAKHNIGQTAEHVDRALRGVNLNPDTHPVVALLDTMGYRRLFEGLTRNGNIVIGNTFSLIATTRMAKDASVVRGFESEANMAVSLSYAYSNLTSFETYLKGLNVSTHHANPWFGEWFQMVHNCSLTGSSGTMSQCDVSHSITDGSHFHLMHQVKSVINSVYAIAHGLDATLIRYCGVNYNTMCASFLTAFNRSEVLLEHIKQANFPIEDTQPAVQFSFHGNSAALPFVVNRYDYDTRPPMKNSFTEIGEVNPWTKSLNLAVIPMSTMETTCPAPCLSCLYTFNYLDYWYVPGDVVIAAIFDVHYKGTGPFDCGELRTRNGALYTEVFNFALQRINSGAANVRLNGVTLGGLSFDGCSNPSRASAIINRVHTGMEIHSTGHMRQFMINDLISWITYDSQTTVDAVSLVKILDMMIVSPGATSMTLNDKMEYSTFFRTIPSDSVAVQGMAHFVREMGWRYVISLNAPDTASRESRDYFRELLAGFGICVTASYEFETDGTMEVISDAINNGKTQIVAVFADPDRYVEDFLQAKADKILKKYIFVANRPWGRIAQRKKDVIADSVTFALDSPTIQEFISYLNMTSPQTSDNPWFEAIYEELLDCNLPGSFTKGRDCHGSSILTYVDWEQDIWTLSTINAVYALGEAVHRTLKEKCGDNYMGLCTNFVNASDAQARIMAHMDTMEFVDISSQLFKFIQREANRGFQLLKYTGSGLAELKGNLDRSGTLTMLNKAQLLLDYNGVVSECSENCIDYCQEQRYALWCETGIAENSDERDRVKQPRRAGFDPRPNHPVNKWADALTLQPRRAGFDPRPNHPVNKWADALTLQSCRAGFDPSPNHPVNKWADALTLQSRRAGFDPSPNHPVNKWADALTLQPRRAGFDPSPNHPVNKWADALTLQSCRAGFDQSPNHPVNKPADALTLQSRRAGFDPSPNHPVNKWAGALTLQPRRAGFDPSPNHVGLEPAKMVPVDQCSHRRY
ncbi:hypothetical protein RRG08_043316 [Elysia crispata]|uniref:Receptor ligand binding region domain-containing protein n=1 Tax=Elysia crispata TaxID=231223 RepID=A0AAE1EDB0_9GAST|nr:hypothetical protein RRG08_043316 [Elysia crispata]